MIPYKRFRHCLNRCPQAGRSAVVSAVLAGAIGLAGCSANDDVGKFIVDPGHYSVYHCKDFKPRLASLTARAQQLRNLMDKASEGDGGAVIGNLSYRAEYENVLGEEQVLRRAAAEKNCDLGAPSYQSDQTIR
jgi:hypothetical protein